MEQTQELVARPTRLRSAEPRSELAKSLRRLARNKGAIGGAVVLALIVLTAIFAPALAPEDPLKQQYGRVLQAPNGETPLGTDQFGRDILSRIVVGSRQSLQVAILAIAIASLAGTVLGLITGYYGGWIDLIIQRLIDMQLAFPGILFALAIVSVLGPGLRNAMIAVGISLVPTYARTVRGSVLSARENAYVDAARVLGAGDRRIVLRHILPNVLAPILVLSTVGMAWAILIGASLSFLGLGAQLPNPEWGLDLATSRDYLREAWWMSTFPGLAIMLTVISVNLLGEGLRDALDPRLRTR
ncbi:MAG: peptide/nickel transport system permease protein [Thermomicrobiales bacterium]|nr:peptide/nickel transport system permease protein [Thermomicrobiales bacterium]